MLLCSSFSSTRNTQNTYQNTFKTSAAIYGTSVVRLELKYKLKIPILNFVGLLTCSYYCPHEMKTSISHRVAIFTGSWMLIRSPLLWVGIQIFHHELHSYVSIFLYEIIAGFCGLWLPDTLTCFNCPKI